MTHTNTVWRHVPGYPDFSLSSDGKAKRDPHTDKRGIPRYERELTAMQMRGTAKRAGHAARYWRFVNDDGVKHVPVEDAMWTTFHGQFDRKTHYLAFKNGRSEDARLDNIILKKI